MGKLIFIPLGLTALAWATHTFLQRRQRRAALAAAELSWCNTAAILESHGHHSVRQRLHEGLGIALERLELAHAMITRHQGGKVTVTQVASRGYGFAPGIRTGMELPGTLLFCGSLGPRRNLLAIDYASLTNWRTHPAHEQFGWETYLGAGQEQGEAFLAISCFDLRSRSRLYSSVEKDFIQQFSKWASAQLEAEARGEIQVSSSDSSPTVGEARAARPTLRKRFLDLRHRVNGVG